MLREMSYTDFLAWQAYDRVEPIGDRRGDWQAASVCSAVCNTLAAQSGSKTRYTTKDFLLQFTDEVVEAKKEVPAVPDWQRMKFTARMFVAQANAEKKHGRRRR